MTARKKILIGLLIAILILIIGYIWKGLPMLVSLLLGYYLIWKAFSKSIERLSLKYEEEYGYEEDEYMDEEDKK